MKRFILCCVCMVWLLTGCDKTFNNDMRNIEERDYATVLMVHQNTDTQYHYDIGIAKEKTDGENRKNEEISGFDCDSLEELKDIYEKVKGKDLSLAHLKVILVTKTEPLLELEPCLEQMRKSKEIAKTVPVLFVEDERTFLEFTKAEETSVGTYLNNLVKVNERDGKKIPWLKDYLKAVHEGDTVMIYELQFEDEGIQLVCKNLG